MSNSNCQIKDILIEDTDFFDHLSNLGRGYNSDKISHNYLHYYNEKFSKDRHLYRLILEIGVLYGESLRLWRDYFGNANIYGFDIRKESIFEENRIKCIFGDQSNRESINNIFKEIYNSSGFDIIIDDGSHMMSHQQISLGCFFKLLKRKGYYIIEDVQTSLLEGYESELGHRTLDIIKEYPKFIIDTPYLTEDEKTYLIRNIESIEYYHKKDMSSVMLLFKKI